MIEYKDIINIEFLHKDKWKVNPQFYIIRRDNNDISKKIIEKVDDEFYPYFYVPESYDVYSLPDDIQSQILQIEDGHISFTGKKLFKMICKHLTKHSFLMLRDYFKETYEDDVLFRKRFIIDNDITFSRHQRIVYIDIETNLGTDVVNTTAEIISISIYDSFDKKCYCFVWKDSLAKEVKQFENCELYTFSNEQEMLLNFFRQIHKLSPDVYAGWFVSGFDFPYIINRAKKVGLSKSVEMLSPLYDIRNDDECVTQLVYSITANSDGTKKTKDEIFTKIYGAEIIDLHKVYDKLTYENRPDNLRLSTIGKHVVGLEKIEISNVQELWKNDVDKLIKYNVRDVELCVKIDEKTHLLDYFFNVQQIIPIPLEDVMYNSKVLDCYILKTYHNRFVFPSKRKHQQVNVIGAFAGHLIHTKNKYLVDKIVHNQDPHIIEDDGVWYAEQPKARIYDNIAVFDFSGMYPNIYRTFNISPDTMVEDGGDVNLDGTQYTFSKDGLIPQLIQKVLDKRTEAQDIRDKIEDSSSAEWKALDNLQGGYKTILNSLFGSMGYPSFRLYNPKILNSILHTARKLLILVNTTIAEQGYEVIYCDTDSLFVKLKTGDIEEARMLQEVVNLRMTQLIKENYHIHKSYMKVDCEKLFKNIIFYGVKKAYIGLLIYKKGKKTNELFSRGAPIVRKDSPKIIKDLLKQIYIKILNGEHMLDVRDYLNDEKKKIMKLSLWDIGIVKQISKHLDDYKVNSQHIRAAKYANELLDTKFVKSDFGKLIFIKGGVEDVLLIESENTILPGDIEIDYTKFFNVVINKKLEMLKNVDNLDISTLYTKNKRLEEFF